MSSLKWAPGPDSLVMETHIANVSRVQLMVTETSREGLWSWCVNLMAAPGCGEWISVRHGSAVCIDEGMERATEAWRAWAKEQAENAGFVVTEGA